MAKQFTKTQVSFLNLLKVPETEWQKTYDNYREFREPGAPHFTGYLKRWWQARVREEWGRLRPVYLGD